MTAPTTRRLLLKQGAGLTAAALPFSFVAAQTTSPAATFDLTGQQAQQDLALLQRALTTLHPGLVRYQPLAQLQAGFADATARTAAGCSRADLFVQVSRLAASVRCGHTWASPYNQSQALRNAVLNRADKLPFTLRWVQGRALVTASAAANVQTGDELLAVDGRSAASIAAALLPHLRADGMGPDSDSKRWAQLNSGDKGGAMDRLLPLMFGPAATGGYTLQLRRSSNSEYQVTVAAVSQADRDRALNTSSHSSDWRFELQGDTGLLTLPTMAFWRSRFDARAFLASTFKAMEGVPYLVIDQRQNEGGDDSLGRALLAQLLHAPASLPTPRQVGAYERAPYDLARFLDTWNFGFFDRTGQATPLPPEQGLTRWLLPTPAAQTVTPVATPYAGRTVMLVGAENSSAGFLLARDTKATAAATLLGQPTSGNQRGLNGGALAWITLPHSGVAVDIPLTASYAPTAPGQVLPDAGVQPDIFVATNFDDVQRGVDTEMQAAQALVARWRSGKRA